MLSIYDNAKKANFGEWTGGEKSRGTLAKAGAMRYNEKKARRAPEKAAVGRAAPRAAGKENVMSVLGHLEPERVFHYFEHFSSVPHGSGNTAAISDLCVAFAKEHGLAVIQDAVGNIIIKKPASSGYENAPGVILQAHLDMVCAKAADDPRDMAKEPVRLLTDGEWVWADGTSLGADDLIGVALAAAILEDDDLPHPALEAVFTVDEETSMVGANALDVSALTGRWMLNLDSEGDDGSFTVGCSGGARANCRLPVERAPLAADETGLLLTLSGLRGGHSSAVDSERGNAHLLTARALFEIWPDCPFRLVSMSGGTVDNAIPDQTVTEVAVPTAEKDDFLTRLEAYAKIYQTELAVSDPDVTLTAVPAEVGTPMTAESTRRALAALYTMPAGIQHMSTDFKGLLQTSLSMGIIRTEPDSLTFSYAVRATLATQKTTLLHQMETVLSSYGGTMQTRGFYPGWPYRRQSALRDTLTAAYRELTGNEPHIYATHGGLECGLLIDKLPDLDCVSVGPAAYGIHSVEEHLNVASVGRVYRLLRAFLVKCKPE